MLPNPPLIPHALLRMIPQRNIENTLLELRAWCWTPPSHMTCGAAEGGDTSFHLQQASGSKNFSFPLCNIKIFFYLSCNL